MPDLKEVFERMKAKRKEHSEINKSFKDSLAHNAKHQEITTQLQRLRDEKKMIENEAWAESAKDAERRELLALDIKSDKQMLSDLALNLYVKGKTVEVIDEFNTRWVPEFAVSFRKDSEGVTPDKNDSKPV
jgi:hypothetical protein